jgi:hypothetical protein
MSMKLTTMLQGHLLQHRHDPDGAIGNASSILCGRASETSQAVKGRVNVCSTLLMEQM